MGGAAWAIEFKAKKRKMREGRNRDDLCIIRRGFINYFIY